MAVELEFALEQLNKGRKPRELSDREQQVLKLLANGFSNEEAASLLMLSRRTVEAHRARIMLKLNIHDLAGLVKYALRCGLVTITEHRVAED
jgi:DNA-binding NarL/FixJ family response regulator